MTCRRSLAALAAWFLPSFFILHSALAAEAAGPDPPIIRVRPAQLRVQKLLERGRERSATFRALLDALDRSDLIVYIEMVPALDRDIAACLRFVAPAGNHRYLRISVGANHDRERTIALIGHELQHAVEVAEHAEVRSTDAFRALFQRIGVRDTGDTLHYDTFAARDAGTRVKAELTTAAVVDGPLNDPMAR